jgi:uncharacterized protein YndB with AHSA1/START domain
MTTTQLGTLRHLADGRSSLRYERALKQPVERVWRALTTPAEMADWFPSRVELSELKLGAPLHFVFDSEGVPPMDGEITELDPPRLLAFTWGQDQLRFELSAGSTGAEGGCTLVFTCTLSDPEGIRVARDGTGWHVCLEWLDAHLQGEPISRTHERWQQLHPLYVAEMGGTLMTPEQAVESARRSASS